MKLTTPKDQPGRKTDVNLYYVQSDYFGAVPHVVVHHNHSRQLFCDCRDFMIRQLPKLLTPEFENCKHGQFVLDCTNLISKDHKLETAEGFGHHYDTVFSYRMIKTPKFGVFFKTNLDTYRSHDIPGEFDSEQQALEEINKFSYGEFYSRHFVKELPND